MFIKNNWLRSLSVVLAVALLLTAVGSYLPPGQNIVPFISGSVNATPDQQLIELDEADNRPDHSNPDQYMKFEPDGEDGRVSVIIGFTGEPARGAQRQAKLAQQITLVESFGGDVKRDFTIINAVTARLPLQAVEALSKRHEVSYLEPDYKVSLIAQETPWGIDRVFGPENYSFPTWDYSRGQGIAVAVLDTGIDKDHIDLPAILGGVNTVDDTHWGSDGYGHGTHVAGIIAAVDNDMGVVGAAPDVGLYAVKVVDDDGWGTYSSVIAGIEWAFNNNIPVMNMSLGGGIHSSALKDAVDAAYAGGTLLVASAGNDGDSKDNVLYPARYSSVIAVSASDRNNKLASFSSRGPSIEFIAPGVDILSLYPGNYMVRWDGTSMASPHVAGSAAVLWGANSDLSNVEVRNILIQTAEDFGLSSDHQGYGLVRTDLAVAQGLPASSPNADLSTLTVSESKLNPAFDSGITDYTVDVADDISSIDLIPTLSDTSASSTIDGTPAASGEPKTVVLGDDGTATEIEIIVTATDGETQKTYTIIVDRDASPVMISIEVTVDPATGGEVSGEGSYDLGEEITVNATVHTGYTFYNWTEDDETASPEAEYTFTAETNRTLVANFIEETPVESRRLAGDNRYQTAISISKDSYPKEKSADAVVIARGDYFADALSGGVLAHKENGPLLLTNSQELLPEVETEISRVLKDSGTIYILGGTAAVSAAVENELQNMAGYTVKRIAGKNRIETAYKIAQEVGGASGKAIVAFSGNFPDALAISSYAAMEGIPILTSGSAALSTDAAKYLTDYTVNQVYLVGGEGVISSTVFSEIEALVDAGNVERLGGDNRYDTARLIANKFFPAPTKAALAFGGDFPDALAGGVNAAKYNAPIMLVEKDSIPPEIEQYLTGKKDSLETIIVYGGTAVISKEVMNKADDLIQ